MKIVRKRIAIVLSFALLVCGIFVSPQKTRAVGNPKIYADNISTAPGEEISIPIKISGNTGVFGMGLDFEFDKNILTPIDRIDKLALFSGGSIENGIQVTLKEGGNSFPVNYWGEMVTLDGELFAIKFKVSENASGRTSIKISYRGDDTFDEDYQDVALDCQAISVNISGGTASTEKPENTKTPTKAPTEKPENTGLPTKAPIEMPEITGEPTDEPGENIFNPVYLVYVSGDSYYSDDIETIDGLLDYNEDEHKNDTLKQNITKNGEYIFEFTAKSATDNIYRLGLLTYSDFVYNMKIAPTKLQVAGTTYPINNYEGYGYGYNVYIRDLSYDIDGIGKAVPVAVGDKITVCFDVSGLDPNARPTDNSPAPTAGTSTQVPVPTVRPTAVATTKPSSTGSSNGYSSTDSWTDSSSTSYAKKGKKPSKGKIAMVLPGGKGAVSLVWKPLSNAKGYQLQYALNKKFTKKKKTKNYSGSKISAKIKKLKKGKTYYFRIRAYNKSGGKKKYGSWSAVKKCKVK